MPAFLECCAAADVTLQFSLTCRRSSVMRKRLSRGYNMNTEIFVFFSLHWQREKTCLIKPTLEARFPLPGTVRPRCRP
ncbi:unnamed protein product [Ixodes pacificus]